MTFLDTPFQKSIPLIAQTFEDVFSPQWVNTHITNPTHDLVILRHILPWQAIIDQLVPSYAPHKGRMGRSLRTLVGVSVVASLRQLSDRKVIEAMQENRYLQYFCNVPDQGLLTFLHPSTLCRFRKRVGQEGIGVIEEQIFTHLKRAGAIKADMMLMDSSVLESPIIYRVSKSGRVGLIFVPGIWTLFTSYPLISWHLARFRGARHSGCVYPGSHDLSHQSPIASGDGPCQEDA